MKVEREAVLMRIYVGEGDKLGHLPLYEAIVREARDRGLAGATVFKGVLGYGATEHIRTAKLLDLSADLPMVIEMVDKAEKAEAFRARVSDLFEQANCGGLVTLEDIRMTRFGP